MGQDIESHRTRGLECAFSNAKVVGRLLGTIYDAHFKEIGLRASQIAVLWAIWASEPVAMARLGETLVLDQTSTSRSVSNLRRLGLLQVRASKEDGRVRELVLTPKGKAKLLAAMPMWESAQREVAGLLDLDRLRELSRIARKAHMRQATSEKGNVAN